MNKSERSTLRIKPLVCNYYKLKSMLGIDSFLHNKYVIII